MKRIVSLIVFVMLFILIAFGVLQMRPFGQPENTEMDEYFLENSQEDSQVNNVVTAVLFDYRGLDTLGEATILFSAVSSILTVLRRLKKNGEKEVDG